MRTLGSFLPVIALTLSGILLTSQPLTAGENRDVQLAMHCVATSEYLDSPEECPQSCYEIDCDLTRDELAFSGGWGTIFLVAYNVNGLAGIEFALDLPTSGATFDGPEWWSGNPGVLSLGDITGRGGIVAWPSSSCLQPEVPDGGVAFAYIRVRVMGTGPLVVRYVESSYSYSTEPRNYTLDCTDSFEEDRVVHHHGAVINGVGRTTIADPCAGGPINEEATWGEVKSKYRD